MDVNRVAQPPACDPGPRGVSLLKRDDLVGLGRSSGLSALMALLDAPPASWMPLLPEYPQRGGEPR